jgi:uncharacterized protein YjbI with pentapeptide repeats
MANHAHLARLEKGVATWNAWYWDNEGKGIKPDLRGAMLARKDLRGIIFANADLREANLSTSAFHGATLIGADLRGADLSLAAFVNADLRNVNLIGARPTGAEFTEADLSGTDLQGVTLDGIFSKASFVSANLRKATILTRTQLDGAHLCNADLGGAVLTKANLVGVDFRDASLCGADLRGADLSAAILTRTDFTRAKLQNARLVGAYLIQTNLQGANITGCNVFACSVWGVRLNEKTKQKQLIITQSDEPTITVDDLEVAQFIYLLLSRQKLRNVIDSITSKAVLILGRFTPERKAVLDAIAEELRKYNLLPIIFDFEKSTSRDFTETIKTIAGMCLFVIADITNPKSAPLELQATVPDYQMPFVTIIQEDEEPFSMFRDLWAKYNWVLQPVKYKSLPILLEVFKKAILDRAWAKHKELKRRKTQEIEVLSAEDFLKESETDRQSNSL